MTDFFLLRFIAFVIITSIFFVCIVVKKRKNDLKLKNDVKTMEIQDL